jgi:single-stranded DNA-binding protein
MEISNVPVRLTAEPDELRTTPSGKQVVSFSAAYNWRTRTDGGFTDVETTFFRATLWGEDGAAEFASLGLKKGDRLRVSGRWSRNPWVAKDGKTRVGNNLTVTAVCPSSCVVGGTSVRPDDHRYKNGAIVRLQGGDSGRCDNFPPIAPYTDGVTYAHSHAALRQSGEPVVTSFRSGGPRSFPRNDGTYTEGHGIHVDRGSRDQLSTDIHVVHACGGIRRHGVQVCSTKPYLTGPVQHGVR